ncbi:hypothetical protein AOLI_G00268240 [Acnodon oligacanthus]
MTEGSAGNSDKKTIRRYDRPLKRSPEPDTRKALKNCRTLDLYWLLAKKSGPVRCPALGARGVVFSFYTGSRAASAARHAPDSRTEPLWKSPVVRQIAGELRRKADTRSCARPRMSFIVRRRASTSARSCLTVFKGARQKASKKLVTGVKSSHAARDRTERHFTGHCSGQRTEPNHQHS